MSRSVVDRREANKAGKAMEKIVGEALIDNIVSRGFFEVAMPLKFKAKKKYGSSACFENHAHDCILVLKGKDLHKFADAYSDFSLAEKFQKGLYPDFALVSLDRKRLFIIEVKNQNRAGSVDEKLQTTHFKRFYYEHIAKGLALELDFYWLLGGSYISANASKYEAIIQYMSEQGSKVEIFNKDPRAAIAELLSQLVR